MPQPIKANKLSTFLTALVTCVTTCRESWTCTSNVLCTSTLLRSVIYFIPHTCLDQILPASTQCKFPSEVPEQMLSKCIVCFPGRGLNICYFV